LLAVAAIDVDDAEVSETEWVVFEASATVGEDSFIEDDSVGESFSGCEAWGVAVGPVRFAYMFTDAIDRLDIGADSGVDLIASEGVG
jgi:hypothetical protein